MALATTRIAITSAAATAVATNVTTVTATEYLVGNIRAHVIPAGGPAPTTASTYVEFNGSFQMASASAFDVYMWTVAGNTTIGVVSE